MNNRAWAGVSCLPVLVVLSGFGYARLAQAATLNVPADYATIQAAVNAAAQGDEIKIAAGLYTQQVVVLNKNLSFTGEPGTIIKAWPGMVHSVYSSWNELFEFESANVTVTGIDFEGDHLGDALADPTGAVIGLF